MPLRNRVTPFMNAISNGINGGWVSVKERTASPKLMFIKPRDSYTASRAACLYFKASRIQFTMEPTCTASTAQCTGIARGGKQGMNKQ